MTDVVRSTFLQHLPRALKAIQQASFVALDLEFTGLGRRFHKPGHSGSQSVAARHQLEYSRARYTAQRFAVAQVGVSCFRVRNPSKHGRAGFAVSAEDYEATTFNFNVYPPSGFTFECEPQALQFLHRHDFDFNKFVGQGIPYANQELRAQAAARSVGRATTAVGRERAKEAARRASGFCHVMEALFSSGCTVVGHNMLFDLAFILSHFHGAVPLDVVAFRRRVLTLFRGVWDTKAVAQQLGVDHASGGTGLGSLFSTCTFDTNALHSLECDRYRAADSPGSVAAGQFPHEAGYDAFMTGCVLLELGINRGDLAYDDDGLLRRDHNMANKVFIPSQGGAVCPPLDLAGGLAQQEGRLG